MRAVKSPGNTDMALWNLDVGRTRVKEATEEHRELTRDYCDQTHQAACSTIRKHLQGWFLKEVARRIRRPRPR
jgi:hypothetical protein